MVGGCVWTPELNEVKRDIAHQIPGATFDREVSVSVGPGGIALARAVASFVPGAGEARTWLKDVSRVQVAVYDVNYDGWARNVPTPSRVSELLDDGWELAARVREPDQSVWVLCRVDDESVRELFVVSLDQRELVLVKVKGRLERLIARALTDMDGPRLGRHFHRGA
jgi:hypothetical protein